MDPEDEDGVALEAESTHDARELIRSLLQLLLGSSPVFEVGVDPDGQAG